MPSTYKQRWHPMLHPNNGWTWKFLPGVVCGFLLKCWVDKVSPIKGLQQAAKAIAGVANGHADGEEPVPRKKSRATLHQPPAEELKVVLCVNDELKMGKGKIAAQCGHAIMGLIQRVEDLSPELMPQYEYYGQAKVALKVPNLQEMRQLAVTARQQGFHTYIVHDAGRTQIPAGSATVLAIGPAPKSKLDEVTGHLKLL